MRRYELKPLPPRRVTITNQAERIIAKFGGARRLAKLMGQIDENEGRKPASVYRWTYPRERGGTGGIIPAAALKTIMKLARIEGIVLSETDLYPGEVEKPWKL